MSLSMYGKKKHNFSVTALTCPPNLPLSLNGPTGNRRGNSVVYFMIKWLLHKTPNVTLMSTLMALTSDLWRGQISLENFHTNTRPWVGNEFIFANLLFQMLLYCKTIYTAWASIQ